MTEYFLENNVCTFLENMYVPCRKSQRDRKSEENPTIDVLRYLGEISVGKLKSQRKIKCTDPTRQL